MDVITNIKITVVVILDLSKTFDALILIILLYKLNYYGIRVASLTIIQTI